MARQEHTIRSLVKSFAEHIRELKAPDYKESTLRQHYLNPFWELLGWDMDNRKGLPPSQVEVKIEPSMDSAEEGGMRSREPDYLFKVDGFPMFTVEAKKPSVDIDSDKAAIFQAKRDAWNAQIPFAILTDFEGFRLYDAALKPDIKQPGRGLIKEWSINYGDYPGKWDALKETFGREAVANGSLDELVRKVRKLKTGKRIRTVDRMLYDGKGSEPVGRVFLDYLEKFRQWLAKAIYAENKAAFPEADTIHGAARLTECVQRLIDRLVFIRVCEDRGIAKWGELRGIVDDISANGGDLFQTLCSFFRRLDGEYNGYLFKPHDLLETLTVPADELVDFIRTLYPPDAPWDFAKIGDDILGVVYERFLGQTVTVRRNTAVVEEKPEVRHAGGVYYTPRFVVDTIIRRVIGPKIKGKSPLEVLSVKVLDPACGSGSFLVAAFGHLIEHCRAAVAANPELAKGEVPAIDSAKRRGASKKKRQIAFQDEKTKAWHLAPDFKAALLTSCIHGVDIDAQAVEVTIMSLYLKMLEGALPTDWQRNWLENELLPSLDNNILCGNSLISAEDYDRFLNAKGKDTGGLYDTESADTTHRINRFDWASRARGFGRFLDTAARRRRAKIGVHVGSSEDTANLGGFDCIIGNPPYIRVQELKKWAPEECEFYKWRYKSAAKGNYDIYVVFTEKAIELLAPDGLCGFIMPHKWWQAKYGADLRAALGPARLLRSVVDFRQEQVFDGATTYTAIHVLGRQPNPGDVAYAATLRLVDGAAQMRQIEDAIPSVDLETASAAHPGAGSWSFVSREKDVLATIKAQGLRPLGEVARLAQGLKTSADKVYVLTVETRRGSLTKVRSAETGRIHEIESQVLRPLIKSEHMKRFTVEASDRVLLFPYELTEDSYEPYSQARWRRDFPEAWRYLAGC